MPEQYQYDEMGYIGNSRISVCTDALGQSDNTEVRKRYKN